MDFNVKDAVTRRYSVRTYDKRQPEAGLIKKIMDYAAALENPFGPEIRVQLIEKETAANGEKLGTYGVIKGAKLYLGVTVSDKHHAMEAVGYEFEKIVLYAASLGLGTCWLGGTFNKSAFAEAMEIKEGELFPILSPIGYPAGKKSLTERLMRAGVKADTRLDWSEIFFEGDFSKPLAAKSTDYAYALEMLRLAPSAVNKQPWRVLICDEGVHFYKKAMTGAEISSIDMQRIDLGIAMCHFDLAMTEQGSKGRFEFSSPKSVSAKGLEYIASYVRE